MRSVRSICLVFGLALILAGCRASNKVSASDITTAAATEAPPSATTTSLSDTGAISQAPSLGAALGENSPTNATGFRPSFGASAGRAQLGGPPPPVAPATAAPTPAPAREAQEYTEVPLFDDELDPNWSLDQSAGVTFSPYDSSHWFSELDPQLNLDSGAVTIAATPLQDFGTLLFSVQKGAQTTYLRDKVLGISMWINSGADILDTGDLSVTIIGSDELPYWSQDDYSAFADADGSFSETRLYYLGLNRAIPPDTWAHIVIWLDDLEFDPPYEYVTGFYIKNDADLSRTYYVDNVSLLMLP